MPLYENNWSFQAELDAVNDILSAIGESPVSTLEGDVNADVVNARRILTKINRMEQSKGWTFNIDETASLRLTVIRSLSRSCRTTYASCQPVGHPTSTVEVSSMTGS